MNASQKQMLRDAILRHIRYDLARIPAPGISPNKLLVPVSRAVRDVLIDRMLETEARIQNARAKRLYYLSMEFLTGRSLDDSLCNLRLLEAAREALAELNVNLDDVMSFEPDAGLGNGGLGRLAACFMESLATLGMPGFGYGIDYEYGLFRQEIVDGYQKEKPDRWKDAGMPLYLDRSDEPFMVPLYGRVQRVQSNTGAIVSVWVDYNAVVGFPRDLPVAGYNGETVNYLRLFSARSQDFNLEVFNQGDYVRAVEKQIAQENISRVLYPSDVAMAGKELRLLQEYFLVACSVKDIVRRYQAEYAGWDEFPNKVAVQMNDTHPSLAVAELMRTFVDSFGMEWKRAWEITTATLGYTNHTLLPEALEKWPVALLQRVLPRHTEIIFQINDNLLKTVERSLPGDLETQRRVSLIEEGPEKQVRMANLAITGSHSVNGVSALHSALLRTSLVPDFAALWPERFNNKTNGVAPRRWLLKSNPGLAALLTRVAGEEWITDLSRAKALERVANDPAFQTEFRAVKRANKVRMADVIAQTTNINVDPDSMFDVQVKRIHEYKRQLLNVLRITHEYLRIVDDGDEVRAPRTYIFGGKAAPSYWAAKQIIKLIHNVGNVINNDPRVRDRMKVVFMPDYRVSLAEIIMPSADLSEQISTAGMEASGTGNMKLGMNGALTMGTLDGANVEILEEVGPENIYIFGHTAEEIEAFRRTGSYSARAIYEADPRIRRVVDALSSDRFCRNTPGLFVWVYKILIDQNDHYFHLADLPSYLQASDIAEQEFVEHHVWDRKSILNVARMGKFSSDRTIIEYARDIWGIESLTGMVPSTKAAAAPAQTPEFQPAD